MTSPKRKKRLKCAWVKGQACRYPRVGNYVNPKEGAEVVGKAEDLLACIACLFGWHLELSELKKHEQA